MNDVHIGEAIAKRLQELRMTKANFAHQIGLPQQNVNRILKNHDINTEKLVVICDVLHFNFFKLYGDEPGAINAIASESSIAAVNSEVHSSDCEKVKYLERILQEKERLIQYLMAQKSKDPVQ